MNLCFLCALHLPVVALGGAQGGVDSGSALIGRALNVHAERSAFELRLQVTSDGDVVVAWTEDTKSPGEEFGRGVFVRRWNGAHWRSLGGNLNYTLARNATDLALALDERGAPLLVWNENFAHADINVMRAWRDGTWTNWPERRIGQDLTLAAKARAVAARAGEPVLAFGDIVRKGTGTTLHVRHWQAGTWQKSPEFNNDPRRYAYQPAIALTSHGAPVVAWLEGDVATSDVLVKRLVNGRWQPLGGPLNVHPRTFTFAPQLQLDPQDRPVVAWLEDDGGVDHVYVKRWTGSTWRAVGGALNVNPARPAETPTLALTAQGDPVVAWAEVGGERSRVFAKRWNGRAWEVLGEVSARPGADARQPSVGVDRAGHVYVAWLESNGGRSVVNVQRFGR